MKQLCMFQALAENGTSCIVGEGSSAVGVQPTAGESRQRLVAEITAGQALQWARKGFDTLGDARGVAMVPASGFGSFVADFGTLKAMALARGQAPPPLTPASDYK